MPDPLTTIEVPLIAKRCKFCAEKLLPAFFVCLVAPSPPLCFIFPLCSLLLAALFVVVLCVGAYEMQLSFLTARTVAKLEMRLIFDCDFDLDLLSVSVWLSQ